MPKYFKNCNQSISEESEDEETLFFEEKKNLIRDIFFEIFMRLTQSIYALHFY